MRAGEMRLPQDLANLLAVAVRDVLWHKTKVYAFLRDCDVPPSTLSQVSRIMSNTPTVRIVHGVLDDLDGQGETGFTVARTLLTRMVNWVDLHTLADDRKAAARASLSALRDGCREYESRKEFQERKEREMHAERVDRGAMSHLDHAKLQGFRDEFDRVHAIPDPRERGNRFQDLMNRIFDYYCAQSKGAFNRTGEQIDGLFNFDKHWYFVEVRWKKEKASAADVSVLRDRAKDAFGGDTKALFISFDGFSPDCLESLTGRGDERVVLMDGFDLRCVLDCQIAFDVLLAAKQAEVVQNKRPFIGAAEVIARRAK